MTPTKQQAPASRGRIQSQSEAAGADLSLADRWRADFGGVAFSRQPGAARYLLVDGSPFEGEPPAGGGLLEGEPPAGGGFGTPDPPLGGEVGLPVEVGRTPPLLTGRPVGLVCSLIARRPAGKAL